MESKIKKRDEEWRELLTEQQYEIARKKGTELPFSGKYNDNKEEGMYRCVCCGNELFRSDAKFNSGSGWPSYWESVSQNNVKLIDDNSLAMKRTEVICSQCDAHLGHVFNDGPEPTGLRYCINSASLQFDPQSGADKNQ